MRSHLEPFLGSVCFQPCQVQHVFITSSIFPCDCFAGPTHGACSLSSRGLLFIASLNFPSFLPVSSCLLSSGFKFSCGISIQLPRVLSCVMTRAVLPASETCGTARVPRGMVFWGVCSAFMRASFGNFRCVVVCRRFPLGKKKVSKLIIKTPGDQSDKTWLSQTSGNSK